MDAASQPTGQTSEPMKLAVVLGVHRSGTSLLAAGLKTIGCGLGEFGEERDVHNPKGYFEHPEIRVFNDALLESLGLRWDNWGFVASEVDFAGPALAGKRAEAGALLRRLFPGPGQYAVKDPRIPYVQPFWEAVFSEQGIDVRRIVILRNPQEVAESQFQREGRLTKPFSIILDRDSMHALWSTMMVNMLEALPDQTSLVLNHADLFRRPAETLQACADFLGIHPDPAAITEYVRTFVDPALRRASVEEVVTQSGWPGISGKLYSALRPSDTPRLFTQAEAMAILLVQDEFRALRPFLPAVARSIGRGLDMLAAERRKPARMSNALWHLSAAIPSNLDAKRRTTLLEKLDVLYADVPADPPIAILRARVLEQAGEIEAAEAAHREFRRTHPNAPLSLIQFMRFLERNGRAEEAGALREEGRSRFPGNDQF